MNNVTVFLRRIVLVLALALAGVVTPLVAAQPKQQEVYIPLEDLPPQEQLASAPLLVGAYSFVAVALFLYVLSVARRMTVVQREIERLEADVKRRV